MNGLKHRRKCLISIYQRLNPISCYQWPADDLIDESSQQLQLPQAWRKMGGDLFGRNSRVGDVCAVIFQVSFQGNCLTPETIDPKNKVQQRTAEGNEPNQSSPTNGRARVAFVKNGVNGGNQRQGQAH